MRNQRLTIVIEVWHIEVEETSENRGWYKFEYSIEKNRGKKRLGQIDGTWSNQTKENFEKTLHSRSGAAEKVLERIII